MCRIAVHHQLDAVTGSHSLDCSVIWIFEFYKPSKLGMHKMELGDSVYAAERIMKKRIRNVSFLLQNQRHHTIFELAKAFEITYQPLYLFGALIQLTACFAINDRLLLFLLAPNFKTRLNNALLIKICIACLDCNFDFVY